jgi:hypothetical protein
MLTGTVQPCPMDEARAAFIEGRQYADGTYRYCETHELPRMSIEISDSTGFLLEENNSVLDLVAEVDRIDDRPLRQPLWLYTQRIPLDSLSGNPARIDVVFGTGGDR